MIQLLASLIDAIATAIQNTLQDLLGAHGQNATDWLHRFFRRNLNRALVIIGICLALAIAGLSLMRWSLIDPILGLVMVVPLLIIMLPISAVRSRFGKLLAAIIVAGTFAVLYDPWAAGWLVILGVACWAWKALRTSYKWGWWSLVPAVILGTVFSVVMVSATFGLIFTSWGSKSLETAALPKSAKSFMETRVAVDNGLSRCINWINRGLTTGNFFTSSPPAQAAPRPVVFKRLRRVVGTIPPRHIGYFEIRGATPSAQYTVIGIRLIPLEDGEVQRKFVNQDVYPPSKRHWQAINASGYQAQIVVEYMAGHFIPSNVIHTKNVPLDR